MPKECVQANFGVRATSSCKKKEQVTGKNSSHPKDWRAISDTSVSNVFSEKRKKKKKKTEKKKEWREILGMKRSYLLYGPQIIYLVNILKLLLLNNQIVGESWKGI
jgi:hypothetical protein